LIDVAIWEENVMLRILYVDDDPQYRSLVAMAIKQRLGIEIELASSGHEAIELLNQGERYSVIVSDYSMLNGNGADLFKHLIDKKIFSLFILFTSHDNDAELRSQFPGNTFLGVVSKTEIRKLCSLIVTGMTSWHP